MLEGKSVRKAVEFAVKTEEMGQLFYTKLAKKFSDNDELKRIFELLAQDEALHKKQFTHLLEATDTEEFAKGQPERFEFLRAMSLSEFFMSEAGLYRNLDQITDTNAALLRAFELEKATLLYYNAMQDALEPNEILDAIIKAEKGHVMKIMEYLMTDAKFRGIKDEL